MFFQMPERALFKALKPQVQQILVLNIQSMFRGFLTRLRLHNEAEQQHQQDDTQEQTVDGNKNVSLFESVDRESLTKQQQVDIIGQAFK